MWASVVVEADPVADGARRMLNAVEAMAMDAMFLQRHGAAGYKLMRPRSHAQHEPISPSMQDQYDARNPADG